MRSGALGRDSETAVWDVEYSKKQVDIRIKLAALRVDGNTATVAGTPCACLSILCLQTGSLQGRRQHLLKDRQSLPLKHTQSGSGYIIAASGLGVMTGLAGLRWARRYGRYVLAGKLLTQLRHRDPQATIPVALAMLHEPVL